MTALHIETTQQWKPGSKFTVRQFKRVYTLFGRVVRTVEWEKKVTR